MVLGQQRRDFAHAGDHGFKNTQRRVEGGFLWYIGQTQAGLQPDMAIINAAQAGQGAQQGGFAATIASDQGYPFPRIKLEIRMVEQGNMAVSQ